MRTDPRKGKLEDTRHPECLTLQAVVTLTANPPVPRDQSGSCGFRALCLQVEAAAGLGSWSIQVSQQDAQDTQQEGQTQSWVLSICTQSPGD